MHWKELLPVDRLQVRSRGLLHEYDRKVLTMLYQPLVGAVAYSLYMTMWSIMEERSLSSETSTHHQLMNMMQMGLKQIYEERKKLEGIGLLNTYVKKEEDNKVFLYELQSPLTPERFFNDGVLNVYLYNRLGKTKFHSIKSYFEIPSVNVDGFEAVTSSFNEVFTSLHPSEMVPERNSETEDILQQTDNKSYIGRNESKGVEFTQRTDFDFDLMLQDLSDFIVPKQLLTQSVKETILKLAFVYKIEPLEMSRIVQQAYIHHEVIDGEMLRKEVSKWYTFEHGKELPSLSYRKQPVTLQEFHQKVPVTEEEKTIKAFEILSPYEVLEKVSGGGRPASADLKLVEGILFEQKLNPGVVNVLIDYVMTTNDMKLVKSYVEKIASHWARKKVSTVKEAIALARSEHKKYQEWHSSKDKGKPRKSTGSVRQDKLPKWMNNKKDQTEKISEDEWNAKQKQLEAMLSKYKK
ncbi:replication initiation and membrane attachment family protein [Pseudalkalibacillus caeni]|uniref:Replication initiation and membrane attachment protein n=1 Tax=Exobacillus caeni TaxID=2574798 RepID=A0A5R9FHV8_9BACL|nr:DnaD domain protein [Pseudalkalibacillus caeni]TLS39155.1 Replication initiation and membrane attachment protein [Pseudalkalibacillus caeni]